MTKTLETAEFSIINHPERVEKYTSISEVLIWSGASRERKFRFLINILNIFLIQLNFSFQMIPRLGKVAKIF